MSHQILVDSSKESKRLFVKFRFFLLRIREYEVGERIPSLVMRIYSILSLAQLFIESNPNLSPASRKGRRGTLETRFLQMKLKWQHQKTYFLLTITILKKITGHFYTRDWLISLEMTTQSFPVSHW